MRKYRDKFVAHLDSDLRGDIPSLDLAQQSVEFYYDYIVMNEAQRNDLAHLPDNVTILRCGYDESEQEAIRAYAKLAAN